MSWSVSRRWLPSSRRSTLSIPHAARVAAMWCTICGDSRASSFGCTTSRWKRAGTTPSSRRRATMYPAYVPTAPCTRRPRHASTMIGMALGIRLDARLPAARGDVPAGVIDRQGNDADGDENRKGEELDPHIEQRQGEDVPADVAPEHRIGGSEGSAMEELQQRAPLARG